VRSAEILMEPVSSVDVDSVRLPAPLHRHRPACSEKGRGVVRDGRRGFESDASSKVPHSPR
jgi:hypothetical protein